jgi:hypothetical protein
VIDPQSNWTPVQPPRGILPCGDGIRFVEIYK